MHHIVERLARLMALIGGIVLIALVLLTVISVTGRGLNTLGHSDLLEGFSPGAAAWLIGLGVGPVNGDFELVEAGIAFAIFAFLPICQLHSAHATVDVFTNRLPGPVNRFLAAFWEIVLALVIIVIAWRLYIGFSEKLANGQTTFLLQFPVWWAYAASFAAALVAALASVYAAYARIAGVLPEHEEADH